MQAPRGLQLGLLVALTARCTTFSTGPLVMSRPPRLSRPLGRSLANGDEASPQPPVVLPASFAGSTWRCRYERLPRKHHAAAGIHVMSCGDIGSVVTRRAVCSLGARGWLLLGLAPQRAAADTDGSGKRVVPEDDMEFHQKWMYAKPQDILPYIYATAKEGAVDEILRAMDEFGRHYPMYKLGDEKGDILEAELAKIPPPTNALELGTFLGYSALRTARHLAPGGKLRCVEFNPDHAEVATKVIAYAGLSDRVEVIIGDSSQVLPSVGKTIGTSVDYVLLDHRKSLYLPDLQQMEELGIVVPGTLVVADNVVYPGTPDYLAYVKSGTAWETRLVQAKFEYDMWWQPGWQPKADALSFSRKLR